MTHYTRRSFIKRAGSASLGTALGLGLIPSLTSKLKASDTSGGIQGVVMQVTSSSTSATATPVAFAGGTLNAGVAITQMPTAGVCYAQIVVKWRRWFSYIRGGATIFSEQQLFATTWICEDGEATWEKQYLNEDGSLPAPGTSPSAMNLDSQAIVDASGTNQGLLEELAMPNTSPTAYGVRAAATDGFTVISPELNTGLVTHSVTCCPLSA